MGELQVYGIQGSRTARVLWLVAELGIDVAHHPVHWDGEAGAAEHRARNPNGRVPVIDDDGFLLFESMAINLHLARTRGGALAPDGPREDALALQWSFWVMSECEVWMERVMGAGRRSDSAAMARAAERLERPLAALEASLAESDYLLGARFTVADLNVASVFAWGKNGGFDFGRWPRVDAWLGRCFARPKLVVDGDPGDWA